MFTTILVVGVALLIVAFCRRGISILFKTRRDPVEEENRKNKGVKGEFREWFKREVSPYTPVQDTYSQLTERSNRDAI